MTARAATALAASAGIGPLTALGLTFGALTTGGDGAARVLRITIDDEAGEALAAIADETRSRFREATLLAYEPGQPVPNNHVTCIAQDDAATLTETEAALARGDADAFDPGTHDADRLSVVAARFSDSAGNAATFYRVGEPLLRLRRRPLLGLVYRAGVYHRLEPVDMLLMKSSFDVMVSGGFAFFTNPTAFEHAFGFLDRLHEASAETFTAVTEHLRIEGIDELREAATTNRQMMQMLSAIRRTMQDDPAYADVMTMPRLVEFVEANPDIGIPVTGTGPDARLVFESGTQTRFRLLHLLRDDYLRSVLTDREYEVSAKTRRSSG